MNIRVETNGATFKGTRVYMDEVEVTGRTHKITLIHQAGRPALLELVLLKHKDGQPYLDDEHRDVDKEIIRF